MFLIKLDKITNLEIFQKIYVTISNYGLLNQMFLIYNPNIKEKSYKIPNLVYHALEIKLMDFKNLKEEEIEEILYELIELNSKYIFDKTDCENELVKHIEKICEELGFEYIYLDCKEENKEVDIEKLTYNELNIVYEILELKNKLVKKYTPFDFSIRISIDNAGNVITTKGDYVGNIFNTSFIELLFKSQSYFVVEMKRLESMNEGLLFETSMYEPWFFLKENPDIINYIEQYKINVFQAIKNIKPYQYKYLDKGLVDVLNSLEYIQYDDIYRIVSGSDVFLEYYK